MYQDRTIEERDEFGNLVPVAREEWEESPGGNKTVYHIPLDDQGNPIEDEKREIFPHYVGG